MTERMELVLQEEASAGVLLGKCQGVWRCGILRYHGVVRYMYTRGKIEARDAGGETDGHPSWWHTH